MLTGCIAVSLFACNVEKSGENSQIGEISENSDSYRPEEYEENITTPLLWKVTSDNGAVIWLFGSISEGTSDLYPLHETVSNAFNASASLAVKFDVLDFARNYELQQIAAGYMFYDGEDKISDKIDPALYLSVMSLLSERGEYDPMYEYMRPIFLQELVDKLAMSEANLSSEFGTDNYFLSAAKSSGKAVIEIESVEQIYSERAAISDEMQEKLLSTTVAAYRSGTYVSDMQTAVNSWKTGDAETLEKLFLGDKTVEFEEYQSVLYGETNERITDFCSSKLDSGEEVFVCVGLVHFLGDDGVVSRLKTLGYTVERAV